VQLFKTILLQEDLPIVGQSYENYSLDMKSFSDNIETSKQYPDIEMAKDVAAFANSTGGVILIGAIEKIRHGGHLSGYSPISAKKAEEVRNNFSRAIETRCSPSPLIDIAIIPIDQTRVIAVNTWPFPGQSIGVRAKTDSNIEGKSVDAYFFPLRVGVNTDFIKPEQLPMLMVPEIRRIVILLDLIPRSEYKTVRIHCYFIGSDEQGEEDASLETFDIFSNSIAIHVPMQGRPAETKKHILPLDTVRSVWKGTNGRWNISLGIRLTNLNMAWSFR
jgi:hypothetical protein